MKNKYLNSLLFICIVIVICFIAIYQYNQDLSTRHGVVRANVINIAPEVSGTIAFVNVSNNQKVKKGDILFVIQGDDYSLDVKQAKENYLSVKQHLKELDSEIISANANVKKAIQQFNYASKRYDRIQSFHNKEYVSTDSLDKIKTDFDNAKNNLTAAKAKLQQVTIQRGEVGESNIDLQKAQLALDKALLNLHRTVVYAPVDGRIITVNIHKGDYVHTGKAVPAEVDAHSIWVEGAYPETMISKINVGDLANVFLMSDDTKCYTGYVASIGTAINSKELPQPSSLVPDLPQVFKWVRLAENIPVHIKLDHDVNTSSFVPGQTATVEILK
ncbi:HlyD family secretion protein [Photobacterium leiognathi]|uniref:HlyD family secretion protein n=1 Tax=Photobacterium leiognathi TaxID=553611 RepID=UPI0027332846|nr:HlyD family secretion protein [Photobacterium leiognathi]